MAKCRDRRLMVDVSSSLGEDRVLWDGCMKRRVPQNTLGRKIDNFCPTYAWTPSGALGAWCGADYMRMPDADRGRATPGHFALGAKQKGKNKRAAA